MGSQDGWKIKEEQAKTNTEFQDCWTSGSANLLGKDRMVSSCDVCIVCASFNALT